MYYFVHSPSLSADGRRRGRYRVPPKRFLCGCVQRRPYFPFSSAFEADKKEKEMVGEREIRMCARAWCQDSTSGGSTGVSIRIAVRRRASLWGGCCCCRRPFFLYIFDSIIYLFPYTLFLVVVVFSSVKDNKIIWFFLLPHPSCENSAAVNSLPEFDYVFEKKRDAFWVIVGSLFDCGELERVIEWLVEYWKSN